MVLNHTQIEHGLTQLILSNHIGIDLRFCLRDKGEMTMIRTVKDYEKLSEQYNKMLEERNSLIDDLSWYRAKVNRLERENERYDKQFTDYIDETNISLNLLSEISQHIGNKPSSSTYKYFRAKLDELGIGVGD